MDKQSERLGSLMAFSDLGLIISTYGVLAAFNFFIEPVPTNTWIVCSFFVGIKILILGIADITGIGRSALVSMIFVIIADAIVLLINQLMAFGLSFRMLLIMVAVDIIMVIVSVFIWKSFARNTYSTRTGDENRDWVYSDLEAEPISGPQKEIDLNNTKLKNLINENKPKEEPKDFIFTDYEQKPSNLHQTDEVFSLDEFTGREETANQPSSATEVPNLFDLEATIDEHYSPFVQPEEEIIEEEISVVTVVPEETVVEEEPQSTKPIEAISTPITEEENEQLEASTQEEPEATEQKETDNIQLEETPEVEESSDVIILGAPEEVQTTEATEESQDETTNEPVEEVSVTEAEVTEPVEEIETVEEEPVQAEVTEPVEEVETVEEEPVQAEEPETTEEEVVEASPEETKEEEEVQEESKELEVIEEEDYKELTGVLPKLGSAFEPISVDAQQKELDADRKQIKEEAIRLNENLNKLINIYNDSLSEDQSANKITNLENIDLSTPISRSDKIIRNKLKDIIDKQFVSSNVLHDLINVTNLISNRAYSIDVAEKNLRAKEEAERKRKLEEQKKLQQQKAQKEQQVHFQNNDMDIIIDKADLELLKEFLKQQDANK